MLPLLVAAGRETRSTCPYCGFALARDPLCGEMGHPPSPPPGGGSFG
jgi:hypothetical protein